MKRKVSFVNGFGKKSLLLFILFCLGIQSQSTVPELRCIPSVLTMSLQPVLDLSKGWMSSDGEVRDVPFYNEEQSNTGYQIIFDLPDSLAPSDSLYLYFGGLASSSAIRLNDQLLHEARFSFEEVLLGIPVGQFHKKGNVLDIFGSGEIKKGRLYPVVYTGIVRPVLLMQKGRGCIPAFPKVAPTADTVVIFPPWLTETGFGWDAVLYRTKLAELKALKVSNIYFPFPPSADLLDLIGQMGFVKISELYQGQVLCLSHEYPGHSDEISGLHPWRNLKGESTEHYGTFLQYNPDPVVPPADTRRPTVILFILIPFLGLLGIRVFSFRVYQGFPQYLSRTRIQMDLIRNNKFLKQGQTWILNLLNWMLISILVALFLLYVKADNAWHFLNIFSEESLLFANFNGVDYSLPGLFGMIFIYFILIHLAKIVILGACAFVYGNFGLMNSTLNLENLAGYPLIFLPFIPASLVFFSQIGFSAPVVWIWILFGIIYLIRRIYIIGLGFRALYQLSPALIFLYICAFEILPWVFLF